MNRAKRRRHPDWSQVVTSRKLREVLGITAPRQTWCRPAGSAWETECQRCGRLGRMVRVPWLLVLERDQCARGQGCQRHRKAVAVTARTPRPRQVGSRQVARDLAHEQLTRQRRAAQAARPLTPKRQEVDALVREGRKVARGLDRRTRQRIGL